MPQEKGSVALFTIGREAVRGTVSPGPYLQLPIVSVQGGMTQELTDDETLQGNRNVAEPDLDEKTVALTVVITPDVRSVGYVLYEIFGAPTTTGVGPYTHVFKVKDTLPVGFTAEKYFAVNGLPIQALGCKINGFSFELAPGGKLKMTLNIVGTDESQAARVDAAPYKYPISSLLLKDAELYEAGVRTKKATRFTVDFTNSLEEIRCVAAGGVADDHLEGFARPTFGATWVLESMAMYNKAVNGTKSGLRVKFPSKANAAHYLQAEMAEVRFKVMSPPIPGPGGIGTDLDGIAFLGTDAGASSLTMTLVNDVASYAAIPA